VLSKYPSFRYLVDANKGFTIWGKIYSRLSTKLIAAPNASASTSISRGATADGKPLSLKVLAAARAIF
jgi:hypothetical protein